MWWVGGWQDLGLWGLAWGALVLNGLFFPAASVYMLWAFATTARALRGPCHNNKKRPSHLASPRCMHDCPRQTASRAVAPPLPDRTGPSLLSLCLSVVVGGAAGAGEDSFLPGRYERARRKLLLISLLMAVTWLLGSLSDAGVWAYAILNKGLHPPSPGHALQPQHHYQPPIMVSQPASQSATL